MAKYTIAECPEISITVRGKDSPTTRERAMDKIMQLMDNNELPTELSEGLSSEQLIEVKEDYDADTNEVEDVVVKAVRELNNLANLKVKVQELQQAAVTARKSLDILFIDDLVELDPNQFKSLKNSFKLLKDFAIASVNYREFKVKAESARTVLERSLPSGTKFKPPSSTKLLDLNPEQ